MPVSPSGTQANEIFVVRRESPNQQRGRNQMKSLERKNRGAMSEREGHFRIMDCRCPKAVNVPLLVDRVTGLFRSESSFCLSETVFSRASWHCAADKLRKTHD